MFAMPADILCGESFEDYRKRKTAADMPLKRYDFEDGKYSIVRGNSGVIQDVLRNGEHWGPAYQDFRFSKVIGAMLNRIDELESDK